MGKEKLMARRAALQTILKLEELVRDVYPLMEELQKGFDKDISDRALELAIRIEDLGLGD